MRKFRRYIIYFLIFFFLLLILFLRFSNPYSHNLRLQATGLNNRFNFTGGSFSNYIAQTQSMIKNARVKAGAPSDAQTIERNSPFQLVPDPNVCGKNNSDHYRNGILLIHGLGDSPYMMRAVGRYFQSHCFLVRAILLPGMGTTAGDLTKVSYHEWVKAVQFGINSFNGKVDNLYLAGFSMGGVVVSSLTAINKNLRGVILFSPAFAINSSLDFLIKPLNLLSHIFPRLMWGNTYPENNPIKYNSFPINGISQTYSVAEQVADEANDEVLNQVPLFVVQSYVDKTVKAKKTLEQFAYNKNPLSQLILFSNHGYKTNDKRILVLPDAYPQNKFLDLSHYAVLLSMQDPLFGVKGTIRDCLHYSQNSKNWKICVTAPNNFKGEITRENLKKGIVQRSSYNPFLAEVFKQLNNFINQTGGE